MVVGKLGAIVTTLSLFSFFWRAKLGVRRIQVVHCCAVLHADITFAFPKLMSGIMR